MTRDAENTNHDIHDRVSDRPIDRDHHCVSCGYNLRGLSKGGRCPECGMDVTRSLVGDQLIHADAAWLESLYRGHTLIQVASILGTIIAFVLVVSGTGFWWRVWPSSGIIPVLTVWIPLGIWLVFIVGMILATAPEPRWRNLEPPRSVRRITRLSVYLLLTIAAIGWILPNLPLRMSAYLSLTPAYQSTVTISIVGLTYLAFIALLWHMTQIAARLDPKAGGLHSQTVQLRRYLLLFGLGAMPFYFISLPATPLGNRWLVNLLAFAWLFLLAFLWLGLWAIRLLGAFRIALREALFQARTRTLVDLARDSTS
jgi:hypothetical protein